MPPALVIFVNLAQEVLIPLDAHACDVVEQALHQDRRRKVTEAIDQLMLMAELRVEALQQRLHLARDQLVLRHRKHRKVVLAGLGE